jgi:hypothetical protein
LLERDEFLLAWTIVLLGECIVSDYEDAVAFGWPYTPLFVGLISGEVSNNLYELDGEIIEDGKPGYFGG